MSINKKNKVSRKYFGVYTTNDNQYIARLTHKGQQLTFGPFPTEKEAAQKYDQEVLLRNPKRTRLNFPSKENEIQNYAQRLKAIRKKLDKNFGKKGLSKEQKNRDKYMREKFPIATRNFICARQKWCCNFCKETLSDTFIIDHMVPLFLGGDNGEHNLQSLCPSCDRFKTSYLDNKVLKPMMEVRQLTHKDVIEVQREYYCKKNCIHPDESPSSPVKKRRRMVASSMESNVSCDPDEEETEVKETDNTEPVNLRSICGNNTNEVKIIIGNTILRISQMN